MGWSFYVTGSQFSFSLCPVLLPSLLQVLILRASFNKLPVCEFLSQFLFPGTWSTCKCKLSWDYRAGVIWSTLGFWQNRDSTGVIGEDGKFGQRMAGGLLETGEKDVVWEERWLEHGWECGAPETEGAHAHCWDEMLSTCCWSRFMLPSPGKKPRKRGGKTDALNMDCGSGRVYWEQWGKSKCGIRDLRALERAVWQMSGDSLVEKTRRCQNVVTDSLEGWLYLTDLGRFGLAPGVPCCNAWARTGCREWREEQDASCGQAALAKMSICSFSSRCQSRRTKPVRSEMPRGQGRWGRAGAEEVAQGEDQAGAKDSFKGFDHAHCFYLK